jgi:hypothetical protein
MKKTMIQEMIRPTHYIRPIDALIAKLEKSVKEHQKRR